MEKWDAYLGNGKLAGKELIRGEAVPRGLYHLVSEVLVRHRDGTYLLTRRDAAKPNSPGLYEASAGGSALAGEGPEEAAEREIFEETGIVSGRLSLIYRYREEHAIVYGFLCVTDCEKTGVKLQPGETDAYLWADTEMLLKMCASSQYVPVHRERLKGYLAGLR